MSTLAEDLGTESLIGTKLPLTAEPTWTGLAAAVMAKLMVVKGLCSVLLQPNVHAAFGWILSAFNNSFLSKSCCFSCKKPLLGVLL